MNPLAKGWIESQISQAEVSCLPGTELHAQLAKEVQSASFPFVWRNMFVGLLLVAPSGSLLCHRLFSRSGMVS